MATEKVGIYRNYYGPIPVDKQGKPLPKSEWPHKRSHSWVVRWFNSDGQRYSRSFATRKEADLFAEEKQPKVRDGKADPPRNITLQEFAREHKELMKGNLAPSTLKMHLAALELFAKEFGWSYPMSKVISKDIERFRAGRLKAGLSVWSANREIRTLKRIFNLAISRHYLSEGSNPCWGVSFIKVTPKQPTYCSPDDFQKIFEKAPDTFWRTLLVTIYATGLRLREAMNLTWDDIDFEKNQLRVSPKEKSEWIQAWQPKDHEFRLIPLPEQVMTLLATWQSLAPEKCPYVFLDEGRWEFYRQKVSVDQWRAGQDLMNNLLRRFRTICRRAGVALYTIHDFRRSCITNWAKKLPLHVVQKLAGHSDIKTTQMYYLSIQSEDLRKAQQVQAQMLKKIPQDDLTDQKLTNSGQKRAFPGKKAGRVLL
jgi:integrase